MANNPNFFKFKLIFIFVLSSISIQTNSELISSPEETNWGEWAEEIDFCPNGTFAQGFQLKLETWVGPALDDTSLNGIKLFCGDPALDPPEITSAVGSWGKWRNLYRCNFGGYITGFQLLVEKASLDLDETATNNIRIFCSENDDFIEGDGERWGRWTEERHCPEGQVVCGIQTQVQPDRGALLDDTALNNVAMECCDLTL